MDFFKSAVASAISKGPSFPYAFGDRVDVDQSIWSLANGTKREDGSKCSIFSFDVNAQKSRLPLAKNAVRKLRTLRHPGVIKVLDTVETESYIYVATERLVPLGWHTRRKDMAPETIKWGLHAIAKTLAFINDEASSVHGNVRTPSIFLSESGEWKLGGFEILSSVKDDDAIIYNYGSLVPDAARYAPQEVANHGWEVVKRNPISAVDAYMFGLLIYEVFNGGSSHGGAAAGQTKNIPHAMEQSYKRLTNANPKARLSVKQFLDQGCRSGGFFDTPLIHLTEGIDSMGLKSEAEREEFLKQLDEVADDFPEDFFKMKILPELLKSVEFGGGGPKVFAVVMKIGTKLSDEEYDALVTPVIVRLFTRPDRAIRVCLLDSLPLMIDHLSQKTVNYKIFPQMLTGFTDLAPVVREQTVKAVLTVISKLSDRTINGDLLKYLAKTANDEQPGIRTNTTICLGKIARNIGVNTRTKVLIAAFSRALRDPFVHARSAALQALGATSDLFSEDDCANRVMPAICPSLVDKEKIVREQASKTLDVYLQRVRKYAQTMPETALPPSSTEATRFSIPRIGTTAQDSASWAGWAVSSFTNKFAGAKGEIQETITSNGTAPAAAELKRTVSAIPSTVSAPPTSSTSLSKTPSPLHRQALTSASTPALNKVPPASTENQDPSRNSVTDDEDAADAWAAMEADFEPLEPLEPESASSISIPRQEPPTTTSVVDDNGEPDFASWLNAQAQAKKSTAPLAKGLTKTRPIVVGRAATTGTAGPDPPTRTEKVTAAKPAAVKPVAANVTATKLAAVKVPATKAPATKFLATKIPATKIPAKEEDDEGWDDAWD